MKFVMTWQLRSGGDAEDKLESQKASQRLLAEFTPHNLEGVREWVQRLDHRGGFAVLESDDAAGLMNDMATWGAWLDFELIPVLDIAEWSPIANAAYEAASAAFED